MKAKILIVEDDSYLREGLEELLTKESYEPVCAKNCTEAKTLFKEDSFDLIILDVMLPDGNGLDLCSFIRSSGSDVPVLFLTACDEEFQIVRGLDAGADDYVTKPFRLLELLSRIRALLRRKTASTVYQFGDIILDTANMTVKKGGENLFLTPTEYQILSVLVQNNGVIVTRASLLQRIWDSDGNFIDDNTLSVHISRLRDKIGAKHIATVRGTGYRWEE
ncbi:MAG: response regulator transcription factor [Clostridia bacterium]|nr:response regulator transcription factor [Clostridia bacterium]